MSNATSRRSLGIATGITTVVSGDTRGAADEIAGARAETGRLAAASDDAAFFRTESGRAVLNALAEYLDGDLPPPNDLAALGQEFERWVQSS